MSMFVQAKRKATPLKLALQGVSFSGKTMSAIKLAHGLANGKPVCVIDTENGSAALYDQLNFLHAVIRPPFKPDRYIEAIREAVKLGAGAIVIDSTSHAWQFIIDYKDQLDTQGGRGSNWQNWAKAKPLWTSLKDAILQSPVHCIATFREKADYAVETNDDGRNNRKSSIKKLGTKAIAEEGAEYDFTVVWKLDKDTHMAMVEKDRTGLFDGRTFIIDESIGQELLNWMGEGEIEAGAEWKMLEQGNSEEFEKAVEDADKARKDKARQITNKYGIDPATVKRLLGMAKDCGLEGIQLIIDAERYGARNATAVLDYCSFQMSIDEKILREDQELNSGKTLAEPERDTTVPQGPSEDEPEPEAPAQKPEAEEKPKAEEPPAKQEPARAEAKAKAKTEEKPKPESKEPPKGETGEKPKGDPYEMAEGRRYVVVNESRWAQKSRDKFSLAEGADPNDVPTDVKAKLDGFDATMLKLNGLALAGQQGEVA